MERPGAAQRALATEALAHTAAMPLKEKPPKHR